MNCPVLPSSLKEHLAVQRRAVDEALERWLPQIPACPATLAEAMRYAMFPGGKRLRPMLVILAAEACGGHQSTALPAACAVELVHGYSLVHDDLPAMDDDDMRRGRPTCHKKFGEAMAILAGDALLTLAFDVLSRHCQNAELAVSCCRELAAAAGACGMVGGQVDDMAATSQNQDLPRTAELLQSIHVRKTGALLRCCLRLGGLVARASGEVMAALDDYGSRIGLAFQITDDLLDARGDEAVTGKRVGKDKGRGKLTFPGVLGTEQSEQLARRLCQEGCDRLECLGSRAGLLRELAQYIVERDS